MSPIDVCNMALAHLSDRRISRIDSDAQISDALVRYCSEFYEPARRETLAAHRWTFAKAAASLSARSDVTIINFDYAHQLPNDLLRLMQLIPGAEIKDSAGTVTGINFSGSKIDRFKIVGGQVWSNYPHLAVEYIRDVEDPDEWTPHFIAAVARRLAAYLAGPISDNPNESANQMRIYETVDLPNAQYYDAVQDNSGENSDLSGRIAGSPLLQARFNSHYGRTLSEGTVSSSAVSVPDLDGLFEANL
jgi:hypothetical protein